MKEQDRNVVLFDRTRDSKRLHDLSKKQVWIGTSSWNYPGWLGKVYVGDYSGKRSSFVKKNFMDHAIEEYATVFPSVCFDGAYWRFPTPEQLEKYSSALPARYQFTLKVTDLLTVHRFRNSRDMGERAGKLNSAFLESQTFIDSFLAPAKDVLGKKLGVVIFEFSPFHFGKPFGEKDYAPLDFVKDLHTFFSAIPKDHVKYAVEIRDPEFIHPDFTRYLDCLRHHGVAHVLNEQTWMPEIHDQMKVPNIYTADFTVVRALTRPGMSHEAAVREFEPYDRIQRPIPELRLALAELIQMSTANRRGLYMYVNNRAEGNAPDTIANVLDLFEQDFVTEA